MRKWRKHVTRMQVQELCEAANKEVAADEGVRIANFLCNGNYAVSGGLPGCEVSHPCPLQ
jgi:malonyl CoA-acyl carrier protein transacylase